LLKHADPEGDYKRVRPHPGDSGRDITRGRITKDLHVWQCKFFLDEILPAQKGEIREAFSNAMNDAATEGVIISEWTLCIPKDLSTDEIHWFDTWAEKQESDYSVKITHKFLSDYKDMSRDYPTVFDAYFSDDIPPTLPAVPIEVIDRYANSFFMKRVKESTINKCFYKGIIRDYYYAVQFDIEKRQYQDDRTNSYLEDLYDRLEQLWDERHGMTYSGTEEEDGNELYCACTDHFQHTASEYRYGILFRDMQWQHLIGYLMFLTERDVVFWTRDRIPV